MKKKEVIKHSSAIQVSNEISLLQRRAWNVLLANSFDDLKDKEIFEISIFDLANALQYESKNDKHLKQVLKDLIDIKIEWNVLDKDKQNVWGALALLAEAKIVNGVLLYGYAPTLRKKLNNPNVYARINLSLQNRFRSKHTLALYELCVDYFNLEKGIGQTPLISIEDFRKLMGLRDNEYKQFKHLNDALIKKALKEINEKSNLQAKVEYVKEKRRVTGIRFYISKNAQNTVDLDVIKSKVPKDQKALPLPEFEIHNQGLFETLNREFGISNNKVIEILKTHDEFYIEEVLKAVREQIQARNIKNIGAFTVSAIDRDYRVKKSQHEIEKEKKIELQKQIKKEKEMIEKLREEFEQYYREKTEKIIKGFSKGDMENQLKEFEEKEIKHSNDIIKRFFRESGIEHVAIRPFFRAYIAYQFLLDRDRDFIAWAKKKKHKIEQRADGKYYFLKTVKKKK